MDWGRLLAVLLLSAPLTSASKADERCEACGLIFWRLQTQVALQKERLAGIKAAAEKDSASSTQSLAKATRAKALKSQLAESITEALETALAGLATNRTVQQGACRGSTVAMRGSALRGMVDLQDDAPAPPAMGGSSYVEGQRARRRQVEVEQCTARVTKVSNSLIADLQDELIQAAKDGGGAGASCAKLLGKKRCTAERATLLLGPAYSDSLSAYDELEWLEVGLRPEAQQMKKEAAAKQQRIERAQALSKEQDEYEAKHREAYGAEWMPDLADLARYEEIMRDAYEDAWQPRYPDITLPELSVQGFSKEEEEDAKAKHADETFDDLTDEEARSATLKDEV